MAYRVDILERQPHWIEWVGYVEYILLKNKSDDKIPSGKDNVSHIWIEQYQIEI